MERAGIHAVIPARCTVTDLENSAGTLPNVNAPSRIPTLPPAGRITLRGNRGQRTAWILS